MKEKEIISTIQSVQNKRIYELWMQLIQWKLDLKNDTGLSYMELHYHWVRSQIIKMESEIASLEANKIPLAVAYAKS